LGVNILALERMQASIDMELLDVDARCQVHIMTQYSLEIRSSGETGKIEEEEKEDERILCRESIKVGTIVLPYYHRCVASSTCLAYTEASIL